jgi:hypothetical protein
MKIGFGVLLLAFSSLAYSVNRMIDDSYLPSGGSGITAMALALIHALPMLGVAAWTRSKLLTVLTGIGMVGVAIAIGGARYAVFDLFFVALGTWGAFRLCAPKGLSAQQRQAIENVLDGPRAIRGESKLTEDEKGLLLEKELLLKVTKLNELNAALEPMNDDQRDAFFESMTEEERETVKDLVKTPEKIMILFPNSNFARAYKKEHQREAEMSERKLRMHAERAAARMNAYNAQHRQEVGENQPVKVVTAIDILSIIQKSASKKL